jgi:protocatechuate 3,4-dioxygenase beta subunit
MRVTKMTNYFSSNPTFTYTSLPVAAYQSSGIADQPGGSWTTFPNTTTTQVLEAANGELVTAMSSATAADGFTYNKGLYYVVDISGATPTLAKQGVVDPGQGVSVQMFTAAMDSRGNLGFTWMEGSSTEFVSMHVGALDTQGHFSSYNATPNAGFFNVSFRIGDYSTIVIDPSDGNTFWAANEYSGPDSANDIWRTHITSFSLPPAVNNDWYTINVGAGNTLSLQSYTPSNQGGEFENTHASINIQVYDTFGNLVATGTKLADGVNESLSYKAPLSGQYHIRVYNDPGTFGEYFLSASTPTYASGGITGQVYNDLNGNGTLDSGDPGLDNWVVNVFTGKKPVEVASQMTHAGGTFDFEGLAPGSYTVQEVLQSGWTQTAPAAPGTFTASVTAGNVVSGLQFGNFQNVTFSGNVFNDLNGDGVQESGEPGLANWSVQLLNSAGKVLATQTTDAKGNYSFTNLGPGAYSIKEVLQNGYTQTSSPATFLVTAASGQNVGGLAFGDFQLVTYSGTVYNDLNGNGVMDSGEPTLKNWTLQLVDAMGNVVATQTTGGNGKYSFTNVGPGMWTIQEVNQSGWYQTQPVNPPGTYVFDAVSGTNQSNLNYGNFQEITLSGSVYNDLNGDGKKNGSEPGLANWTVELFNPSGNVVASVLTDASGNYSIGKVFPGTFTLAEIPQAGWVQTQPLAPNVYTITPQSGQNQTGLLFGVHSAPPLSPTATIDNGQAGYAETGTWTTAAGGFNGTNRYARTTGGKTATATATWTFSTLSSGSYDVYITYFGQGNYSKAAPFSVYDGSTNLGTTSVDESILVTQAHGSLSQGSYGGVGWLYLGTFSISSGTLKVQLSNLAGGTYVDADAALIIGHGGAGHSMVGGQGVVSTGGNTGAVIGTVDTSTTGAPNGSQTAAIGGPLSLAAGGSTAPATGTAPAAATISLAATSQSEPLRVVYNQGSAQAPSQPANSLIDVVLPTVGNRVKVRQQVVTDAAAALAKALFGGDMGDQA